MLATMAVKRRVLVADDNEDSAETLSLLLQALGNEVRTVHDGRRAVEEAEAFRPDAVLLDIGMPGLDGYEVARLIRAAPWGRAVVLIALTGWGLDEDVQRAREAGFDRHLLKPVDIAPLQEALASSVRGE
jgi:CheY-like chemotaxis protein